MTAFVISFSRSVAMMRLQVSTISAGRRSWGDLEEEARVLGRFFLRVAQLALHGRIESSMRPMGRKRMLFSISAAALCGDTP